MSTLAEKRCKNDCLEIVIKIRNKKIWQPSTLDDVAASLEKTTFILRIGDGWPDVLGKWGYLRKRKW